ncbi:murein biosynthesis integral membrane protein MurJ [Sediminibacillus massiliensis]|uniref:murein biosynthesis integral membrane protein MurJ n=1 Tax=Sediminibacillus massiliensis TaxID=1926277 RepID=UPI000988610D|nr:murein biosynthesis integral membrane protein MurJ [Sediminibacillus massiliensis]
MSTKLGFASILFILTTLLLKLSGLLRDIVIAYFFGDTYQADAFLAAFIIPNMLFLFMNNGMKNAFVPSYVEADINGRGHNHLANVLKGTAMVSILIAVIGVIVSPYLIPLLYGNFSEDAKAIAVKVSVVLMAALVFVGVNSVLEAYLDAKSNFSLSALSQVIVVLTTIAGAVIFADKIGPLSLALGYLLGALISLFYKLFLLVPKQVFHLKQSWNIEETYSFYKVFIPVAMTVMVGQINLAVDNVFAGRFEEGTVTYINYAKNLVHFPQSIFAVTLATMIFPILSKAYVNNDTRQFKAAIGKGLQFMYFILLPSITGMFLLMPYLISFIYERGAFTHEATIATSYTSYFYFGSVLFFSLSTVINKGFYTLKKGHLIMGIGAGSICLNLLFNYLFTNWIGYIGIPLASSMVAFVYLIAGAVLFNKLAGGFDFRILGVEFTKITLCGLGMLGILALLLPTFSRLPDAACILLVSISGVCIYLIFTYIARVETVRFILKDLRKKREYSK